MSYYAHRQFNRRAAMVFVSVVVIVWAVMLSGCQIAPYKEYCSIAQPITVSCATVNGKQTCRTYVDTTHDYLTPETEKQILSHDETYSSLCH